MIPKLKALNAEVKRRRHERIPVQGRGLSSVVCDHVAYTPCQARLPAQGELDERTTTAA